MSFLVGNLHPATHACLPDAAATDSSGLAANIEGARRSVNEEGRANPAFDTATPANLDQRFLEAICFAM